MRRILAILRHSLVLERAARGRPRPNAEERAFLPAVLEITETPPSPTARILTWAQVGFFVIGLV
ncbi:MULTISPECIES: hypothetical protein [Roseomonadaceae]|uniref:Uncharacterized protein n=1 Tax=Falsiroseomonas oleicola TaxID=2801474 RepID=A0ABS6HBN9_9PROT|nr:hypothetical protein [Roseomonas oleicola]MBU8545834.1 hypothetical protein [Roseomonas oleicola]